jgi:hypothetical protein
MLRLVDEHRLGTFSFIPLILEIKLNIKAKPAAACYHRLRQCSLPAADSPPKYSSLHTLVDKPYQHVQLVRSLSCALQIKRLLISSSPLPRS